MRSPTPGPKASPWGMLGMLWRLALRNAKRHKAQAFAAAAAVAVGTTVLAASLAAGQAAQSGISQVAFDVLGEHDELVRTEGDFFFPEEAGARFAQEVNARRADVAVSPGITHVGVAGTPAGLTEPDTLLIGFPRGEQGFGAFEAEVGAGSLEGLSPGEVLVNRQLADALELVPGDTVQTRFAPPLDPLVPTVHDLRGNVSGAALPGALDPLPAGGPANPTASTHEVDVAGNTSRLVAILIWGSAQNATDLDLELVAPNGTSYKVTEGATGEPDVPAVLDVAVDDGAGSWTARVTAKAAADQPYRLVLLELAPATSIQELREGRRTLEELGTLGDRIRQARGMQTATVTVAGVVSGEGKGGFLGGPALFMPLPDLQGLLDRPESINVVRISNPGGVRDGVEHTSEVMPVLEASLDATKAAFDDPTVQALLVEPTKQDFVDRAEQAGAQFTRFLTTLSSFTIVAGILLVVNLFTMLGEERRSELAVMRALGLEQRHLVATLTMEGTLYALPGAPIGALAGIGLAWVLIRVVNDFVVAQDALPIPFVVEAWTPVVAALLGLAFTIAAVAVTGWRLSRLHIASGLKGREEERPSRRALVGGSMALAGALVTPLFWVTGLYTMLILGPSLLLFGGAMLALRNRRPHHGRFVGSLLVLPYLLWTIVAFLDIPPEEVPYVAPLRGTIMVIAGVVALLNLPALPRMLKAVARRAGRWSPATMVALAYPVKKQMRTGLTASMFALVLLVLAVFSSFFTVFQVDPAREAGGYDLYAETSLPVDDLEAWAAENLDGPPESLQQVALTDVFAQARVFGGDVLTLDGREPSYNGPPVDWFYGIDQGFAEHNGYNLVARSHRFTSDQAAYQAVVDDPGLAIVSRVYDMDEAGRLGAVQGGERLEVALASTKLNLTVVGAQEQLFLGGIFLSRTTVEDLFPTHGTGMLMRVQPGQDPVVVARQLEQDFSGLGLNVDSIEAEARELQQLNARFFTVLQVFLGLGLVIGVASLGIVTAKSALERERELGVLRAMGLPQRQIAWSLTAEAMFTAFLGILPGIAIGVAVSYAAYLAFFQGAGVPFSVPWGSIFWLSLISLAAGLASTILPARRAARTDVSKAIRLQL